MFKTIYNNLLSSLFEVAITQLSQTIGRGPKTGCKVMMIGSLVY